MEKSVVILEKCLQFLEDRNLMKYLRALVKKTPEGEIRSSFVNHNKLRPYLQNEVIEDVELSDKRFDFEDAHLEGNSTPEEDETLSTFGYCLSSWVQSSRRVFDVESDLQTLLSATSFDGLTFEDIRFPFTSFLVSLGYPLIDKNGDRYSNILVKSKLNEFGIEHIWFHIIDDNTLQNKTLEIKDRVELQKALKSSNSHKLQKIANKIEDCYDNTPWISFRTRPFLNTENVEETIVVDDEWKIVLEGAIRIVTGLCMYLKTLPVNSPHVSDWKKLDKVPTVRGVAVSTGSQACSVESYFRLSPEEREVFGDKADTPTRSFGEKCCHFRRGTWCRPKGSSPDAKRTELRRPTIVRKDKLIPGSLPKGAEVVLGLGVKK